jgi:hypothetical protein
MLAMVGSCHPRDYIAALRAKIVRCSRRAGKPRSEEKRTLFMWPV